MPVRLEILLTAGRKSAAAPTFCMNPEMMPTVVETIAINRLSVLPASRIMGFATRFITPVLSRPAPIIMTAIMEITALLEKPLKM